MQVPARCERHGLKAVIFLEALSAGVLGLELLTEVVGLVQDRGHEVGLHIHTEWLSYYKQPLLGDRYGRNMCDFSEDDQVRLIDNGLENLSRARAEPIVALRAGNGGRASPLFAIWARLAAIAVERGWERIDFQVLDWNPARDFYRRLGLEHLGEWLRYGGDAAALSRLAAEDLPDRD